MGLQFAVGIFFVGVFWAGTPNRTSTIFYRGTNQIMGTPVFFLLAYGMTNMNNRRQLNSKMEILQSFKVFLDDGTSRW